MEVNIENTSNKLAAQLLRKVFSWYIFIAIGVTLVHLVAEYFDTRNDILVELSEFNTTFQPGLSQALWSEDEDQLASIPKGMLNIAVITYIEVKNDTDEVVVSIGENKQERNPLLLASEIMYSDDGENYLVGSIKIHSENAIIIERMKYRFGFIVANSIIKSLALWLIFLWFGKRMLSLPLSRLTESVAAVDLDTVTKDHFGSTGKVENELTTLRQEFALMAGKIADSRDQILSINQRLEEEILDHKQANDELRRIEQELQQHKDTLEEQVAERTQELTLAKDEAEKANQAKSRFLSRMTHELRTPMNAVLGFASLQKKMINIDESPRLARSNEEITASGMHLLGMINDILDHVSLDEKNKIQRADQQTNSILKPIRLNDTILQSIQKVQEDADKHQIEIVFTTTSYAVQADEHRLKQVMINLLSNGIKYNQPAGTLEIEVNLVDDDYLDIEFKDTGVGISEKDLETIFEPFNRLVYAEQNEVQGTGIGLSLTKYLVKEMQGEISCSSIEGQGSRFVVRLKRAE